MGKINAHLGTDVQNLHRSNTRPREATVRGVHRGLATRSAAAADSFEAARSAVTPSHPTSTRWPVSSHGAHSISSVAAKPAMHRVRDAQSAIFTPLCRRKLMSGASRETRWLDR